FRAMPRRLQAPRGPRRSGRRTRTARMRPTAPFRMLGSSAWSAPAGDCTPGSSKVGAAPGFAPSGDAHLDVAHRAFEVEGAGSRTDCDIAAVFRNAVALDGDLAHRRARVDAHARIPCQVHLDLYHLAANRARARVHGSVP